ncbi:MAG: dTMP kinase [Firmicutes bacterium]|nr:dTMP kinase [Bacillota bacterium]
MEDESNIRKGRLIVVEGCDGSGKSTQAYLLYRWLQAQGYYVFWTEWNSSPMVKKATKRAKKNNLLTPTTFSLIHASDFADRYEREIYPRLRAGYIVLADRYIYTAFARDVARGCTAEWVRNLYDFALLPDLIFYFSAPVEVMVQRILRGRSRLKYYEAGMDLHLSNDVEESFRLFQQRIWEQYEGMIAQEGFTTIDATASIEAMQERVREQVAELLAGFEQPQALTTAETNRRRQEVER